MGLDSLDYFWTTQGDEIKPESSQGEHMIENPESRSLLIESELLKSELGAIIQQPKTPGRDKGDLL